MLPKEQMTAWQRWELASFDNTQKSELPPGMRLPTVEELEALREQARKEGYAAGHAEGLQSGHIQGHAEGLRTGAEAAQADIAPIAARMNALLTAFDQDLLRVDALISSELMTLACDLAAAMLKTALPIRPELLLPLVSQAIASLPVLQRSGKLFLHPSDAALVKTHLHHELTQQNWQVIEDAQIQPGGCRLDSHSNLLDATLEGRWQRLMTQLGQNTEWFDGTPTARNDSTR